MKNKQTNNNYVYSLWIKEYTLYTVCLFLMLVAAILYNIWNDRNNCCEWKYGWKYDTYENITKLMNQVMEISSYICEVMLRDLLLYSEA